MKNRRAEFTAKHSRRPSPDEEREIRRLEQEDRRIEVAERQEREVKRAYLSANPGADEALWEREKTALLAADRAARAKRQEAAARESQSRLYRSF